MSQCRGVLLMGPTAAGKTAAAMALVARFPLEIVSVDSAMVYRGMDIGTAKPSAAELQRAPHRLIDIRDPEQGYSVAEFLDDAREVMAEIRAAGRLPLLAGGTMMYFRALQQGLSSLPNSDAGIRAELESELHRAGSAALHQRLAGIDPASAARIHHNDPQRILRALEVYAISGQPLSQLQQQQNPALVGADWLKISIEPRERELLRQRIALRFDSMLEAGFLDEVRRLRLRPGLRPDMPAMRAVGYRQAWQYLEGDFSKPRFRELAITATRQLAKRQITWLRRETGVHRLEMESDTVTASIDLLGRHLPS